MVEVTRRATVFSMKGMIRMKDAVLDVSVLPEDGPYEWIQSSPMLFRLHGSV